MRRTTKHIIGIDSILPINVMGCFSNESSLLEYLLEWVEVNINKGLGLQVA